MHARPSTVAVIVLVAASAVLFTSDSIPGQDARPTRAGLMKSALGPLPVHFVENRGTDPDDVRYHVKGSDRTIFFTRDSITFRLKGRDRAWVVKLVFTGRNPHVTLRGEGRLPGVISYFRGPARDWRTGLATYGRIRYHDLWPGIDLVFRGAANRLKYEFVVRPGADPSRIQFEVQGATALETTPAGGLRIETPAGTIEDAPPEAWQDMDGARVAVAMAFSLDAAGPDRSPGFGFRVGPYDPSRPLVLDPALLVYCGYLGGALSDCATAVAVDTAGNVYVAGYGDSDERTFPVTSGPDMTYNGSTYDAFVAKVNPQGTTLLYCGYIGGDSWDDAYGIAVDSTGHAYVTGSTYSTEQTFPVQVGPDLTFNGLVDAFVAKVNPQGTALVYCGYIGGALRECARGIALNGANEACVAGWTCSNEQSFPVTVGPDLTYNGSNGGPGDAFVARVNAQGTALDYCGYIGGVGSEVAYGIAVDRAGNTYVAGVTISNEQSFPVLVGPDLTQNGNDDAFVAKVNPQGTALVYCGYIGGTTLDIAYGIAVDASGNAYVAGSTFSDPTSFPVTVGPCLTFAGPNTWPGGDAFVARVNPQGTGLSYCGYIGGTAEEEALAIAVDASQNAYVTGYTMSYPSSFPVAVGPSLTFSGPGSSPGGDAFVTRVNAQGTALVYCGYIGGRLADSGQGIAVDALGHAFVVGSTLSDEKTFPVANGPDLTFNGTSDAFLAKVALTLLTAGGTPRPGGKVDFHLVATGDAGLPFQLGTSLGTGPIQIDRRMLQLSMDEILRVSVTGVLPGVFVGYTGILDTRGQGIAALHVPNLAFLVGQRLHTAFVTLDPAAPSGLRSISDTCTITIMQ